MSNPTSNFNWQMPTATDLVTDLPADFEVFGQAVDTSLADLKGGTTNQVLAKNSDTDMDFKWVTDATGMTNPMTTTGDTIYSSSGSTPARLGIGTAGQVLQVNSGATAPEWAAAPTSAANWSIVNSGGTNLTGATTITVSGITGADKIMILIEEASCNAAGAMRIRLNTDTASNYYYAGATRTDAASYSAANYSILTRITSPNSSIAFATPTNSSSQVSGFVLLSGCNTAGLKMFNSAGAANPDVSNGQVSTTLGGFYNSSSTISSVSINTAGGNFYQGKIYVYKSA